MSLFCLRTRAEVGVIAFEAPGFCSKITIHDRELLPLLYAWGLATGRLRSQLAVGHSEDAIVAILALISGPISIEIKLHGFAVAGRQHEGGSGPLARRRPPRTKRSIGCVDRGRREDAKPSGPSGR